MHLAAMMGLMVEHVQERIIELLLDITRVADRAVADRALEVSRLERADIVDDTGIFRLSRHAQGGKILIEDGIELRRARAVAG